jgi:hypothetical protein
MKLRFLQWDFWPGIIFALPVIRPESGPDPVAETLSAIPYQQRDFFVASLLGGEFFFVSMGWFPARDAHLLDGLSSAVEH